jgi:hypothetical protein
MNPRVQSYLSQSAQLSPFAETSRHAADRDDIVASPVSTLFLCGSPSAIRRLVVAIHIDPIDRHAGRAFAHVGEEVPHVMPALADRDSACAVMAVTVIANVVAAAHRTLPRTVRASRAQAVGCRGGVPRRDLLALEASATFGSAVQQLAALMLGDVSALATAPPGARLRLSSRAPSIRVSAATSPVRMAGRSVLAGNVSVSAERISRSAARTSRSSAKLSMSRIRTRRSGSRRNRTASAGSIRRTTSSTEPARCSSSAAAR